MPPHLPGSVQSEESGFRRVYLMTIAVPLVLTVVVWARFGTPNPFLWLVFPTLVLYLGVLLIGVWSRRIRLRLAGRLLFVVPVVLVFGRLMLWRLGLRPELGLPGDAIAGAVWIPAIFLLAFIVFGTRRGMQISFLVYLGFVVIYGPTVLAVLLGGTSDPSAAVAFAMVMTYFVLGPLIWLLASRLESLTTERVRADLLAEQINKERVRADLLAEQANTDALTEVANRRHLDDEFKRMIAEAHRHDVPLSVVLFDLDNFKDVNDEYGHSAGDRVLVEVAQRVKAVVRDTDLFVRWGGDEFLLVAPHTDYAAAMVLAERCRVAIGGSPMEVGEVTASFGVATLEAGDDADALFHRADLVLHSAKQADRAASGAPLDSPDDVDGSEARQT
ncbi:MAG: diguanylate cyclase [Nitriliruptoraceae bacterium]